MLKWTENEAERVNVYICEHCENIDKLLTIFIANTIGTYGNIFIEIIYEDTVTRVLELKRNTTSIIYNILDSSCITYLSDE